MSSAASSPWEKSGNTSWVRCKACDGWFHAAESMLAETAPPMHCPHCHAEFGVAEAGTVVRAG